MWLLNLYLNILPVSPIYCASGHFLQWIKYATLAESQLLLPDITVLWLMKTLVAVLMCLQTLHLCLPHGLLHSGSSSVIVFLIRSWRRLGGCLECIGGWTKIPPIFLSSFRMRQLDLMLWMKWSILGLNLVIRQIFLCCCLGVWECSLCLSICLTLLRLWRMSEKGHCLARKYFKSLVASLRKISSITQMLL